MTATLVAGIALIAWGVIGRDLDLAAVKWIAGLILLVALPVERCLIGDGRAVVAGSGDGSDEVRTGP
jgi:hypothetical protein